MHNLTKICQKRSEIMFLGVRIKNFLSICDEAKLSFQLSSGQKLDASSVTLSGVHVNKLAGIVGPNAAGKSNLLKGIVMFSMFVRDSYRGKPAPYFPHFFSSEAPSFFAVDFIQNDEIYSYSIEIKKNEILSERLRKKNKKTKRYNFVFQRVGNKLENVAFKVNPEDEKRLDGAITAFSLLKHLNYFKTNGFEGDAFGALLQNVLSSSPFALRQPEFLNLNVFAETLEKDPGLLKILNKELCEIDTGIDEIKIADGALSFLGQENQKILNDRNIKVLTALHHYRDKTAVTPIFSESSGTIFYMQLFASIIRILKEGGLLIADELENSLHIDLVERILNLFLKKETNPNNAQILFTTHNPWFLQYLTKTQIFITQKKEDLSTECFRLDEVEGVRNDENFFMKYISGEYEGKPRIKGE